MCGSAAYQPFPELTATLSRFGMKAIAAPRAVSPPRDSPMAGHDHNPRHHGGTGPPYSHAAAANGWCSSRTAADPADAASSTRCRSTNRRAKLLDNVAPR